MAAPVAVARTTPGGLLLPDGYQSLFTFNLDPDVSIWEVGMTPGGIEVGPPINITSQHNSTWRTFWGRQLSTLKPFTVRGFYDPNFYNQLLTLIATRNQEFTQEFYDGTTCAFWGTITDSTFSELVEGTAPEVTIVVTPTNRDNAGAEQAPVITSVAGT